MTTHCTHTSQCCHLSCNKKQYTETHGCSWTSAFMQRNKSCSRPTVHCYDKQQQTKFRAFRKSDSKTPTLPGIKATLAFKCLVAHLRAFSRLLAVSWRGNRFQHGVQPFMAEPHLLLRSGLPASRVKITVSCIPSRLSYCGIFMGIRGRRRKQILADLQETRGYGKLKKEALDRTVNNSLWKGLWTCRKADYGMMIHNLQIWPRSA